MAYSKVSTAQYDEINLMIERFQKLNKPFEFNENTSLAKLIAINAEYKAAIDAKNTSLEQVDKDTAKLNEKDSALTKIRSSFRMQIGDLYGKDSDEYVWAGGIRQSEALEKAKATRLERLKAEEEKNKAV
jgi:N-acetylneuraminic acid mutarotase